MPLYPEYLIREVADKNDIRDVISQYVNLKKAGSSYVGLCPFHNEKTPSFSVSPQKGIFHCFGCGEGGNVIHFMMKIENMPFVEAVEKLAQRAGTMDLSDKYNNHVYEAYIHPLPPSLTILHPS